MFSHFSLTKRSDGWLIAVDGADLLLCARRKAALRAIRDAIARELSLDDHVHAYRAQIDDAQSAEVVVNAGFDDRGCDTWQAIVNSSSSRRG